jgi:hypothetical protein
MDLARSTDTQRAAKLAVEEEGRTIVQDRGVVADEVPKFVTQARASYLLGIPEAELLRISKESGLGLLERAGNEETRYFTYEELRCVCLLASHFAQTGTSFDPGY